MHVSSLSDLQLLPEAPAKCPQPSLVNSQSRMSKPDSNALLSAGHINFNDEVSAAMRLADGVLLVVDAAEGVMMVTEKAVRQALGEGLPIALLISKVGGLAQRAS